MIPSTTQIQQHPHRLSVSTTSSSNNYTYQLSQDGRNLAYTMVTPNNGNSKASTIQVQPAAKAAETAFVDGATDVDLETDIIDGIPASEILKMADGDILSQALASTGVTGGTEDDQQLLEAITF